MFPQTSHQEFSSLKQSNSEANQREEVLKKLASAHDSYVEISSNLREGTKVARQHTHSLAGMNCTALMRRTTVETFKFFCVCRFVLDTWFNSSALSVSSSSVLQ